MTPEMIPVDHDPFAQDSVGVSMTSVDYDPFVEQGSSQGGVKLTPVDHDPFSEPEPKNAYLRTMDAISGASKAVGDVVMPAAENAVGRALASYGNVALGTARDAARVVGADKAAETLGQTQGDLTQWSKKQESQYNETAADQLDGKGFWGQQLVRLGQGAGALAALPYQLAAGGGSLPLGMALEGLGHGGPKEAALQGTAGALMQYMGGLGQELNPWARLGVQVPGQAAVGGTMNTVETLANEGRFPTSRETMSSMVQGAPYGVMTALEPHEAGIKPKASDESGVRIDTKPQGDVFDQVAGQTEAKPAPAYDVARLNATTFPGSTEGNHLSPYQLGQFMSGTPAGQALGQTIADLRAAGHGDLADKLQVTSANQGEHVSGSLHYKGLAVDTNARSLTPDEQATVAQFAGQNGLVRDVAGEPWHYSYRGQAQAGANVAPGNVPGFVQAAAAKVGEDPAYLGRTMQAESGGDANARATTSSATGLFQFTAPTWRAMVNQYGRDYGLTADGITDPAQQATAAALLTRDNRAFLQDSLGRTPSDGDLYMAHLLGRGGADQFLTGMAENPNDLAINHASPAAVRANRSIFFAKDHTRTLQEVYDLMTSKVTPQDGQQTVAAAPQTPRAPAPDSIGGPATSADASPSGNAWPLRPELADLRTDMEQRAPGLQEAEGSPWDTRPPATRIDDTLGLNTPLARQAELDSLRQDIQGRDVFSKAADEMGAPVPAVEAERIGQRPALPEGQGFDMVPGPDDKVERLPSILADAPTMPAQPGDIRFHLSDRPAEAIQGIRPEDVVHGIKGYAEQAPGAAPVRIVRTQDELPAHILEQYRRSGETGGIEGVYDRNSRQVWLVADNLESRSRAGEVWLHEQVAHNGLRAVFGSDPAFDKFLEHSAKFYGYGDPIGMEEHIARLAEKMDVGKALTPQERSLWGRFVDYVRGWLVKNGWATPSTEDLHNLLRDSLVRMTRGGDEQGRPGEARFSVAGGQTGDYQRDRMAFDGKDREPLGDRVRALSRDAYRRIVSKDQPVVDLARQGDSVAAENIENQIRRMRGLGGIVEEMLTGKGALRYGIDGQETVNVPGTKSLKDILSPLKTKEQYRDYESLRAAEREKALAMFRPDVKGNDINRAQFEINRLERKYGPDGMARLRQVSAEHRQFERDAILAPLHEAGWISKEAYDAILKAPESQYYASFSREMEDVGNATVGSRDVVRKIAGSERRVLPSTEATIANVARAVKLVETLKLHQSIVSLRDLTPDLAEAIKPWKKGGLPPRDALVTAQNGQKTYWKAPDDVAKALGYFNPREVNVVVKALSYPAHWLRAGATLGLEFIARNPVRDQMSAFVFSKYGYNPATDFVRGLFHTIKGEWGSGSDWYSQWRAAGGAESFFTSLDRDAVRVTTQDLVAYRTGKDALGRYVKNPLDALRAVSEFMEKGTRVGAFIKAREKGATPLEAMAEARDLTLDFSRMGADTKVLNQVVAFWNANVQGVDKLARSLKDRPGQTLLRVGLGITLPSLTLSMMNQGQQWYEELPAWQRDYFWCFKAGDTIIRVPKPFELGILFGSLPERIVDFAHKEDPQGLAEVGKAAWDALTPGWMPTAGLPLVESIANYSFFRGKPLENQSVQSLPPGMRATSGTSEAFTRLGRATDISPIKMENWFRAWTGSMGKLALDASDLALRDPNIPPVAGTAADVPLLRGFVAREPIGSGSESVDRFYQAQQETTQAQQGRKALLEAGDQTGAQQYDRNAYFAPAARALSQKMSDMRAEIAGIQQAPDISSEDKRARIDAINRTMTTAAREFDEAYRTGNITPEILYLGERSRVNEALEQYKDLVKNGRVDDARALVKSAGLDSKAGLVKWADAAMAKANHIRKAAEDAGPKLSDQQRAAYLSQADQLTQTALTEFQKRMGGPQWQ